MKIMNLVVLLVFGCCFCSSQRDIECDGGICCDAGLCCDPEGFFRPKGYICEEYFAYRCLQQCGGANREVRKLNYFCSGTSSVCRAGGSEMTDWAPMENCETGQACEVETYTVAKCVDCEEDGKICVAGVCQDR